MRTFKIILLAMGVVLLFVPSLCAEITAMSLQERMRQSDIIVLGQVTESHMAAVDESGFEGWQATCRVEKYIKAMHGNPGQEKAKKPRTIYINFIQIPDQKPIPIKLMAGKKYLLFLKKAKHVDAGANLFEMITPYHGAYKEGQEYYVQDEQDPEYPKAAQMTFEEIVRLLVPQHSAKDRPMDQASCEARGGRWGRWGEYVKEECQYRTRDAGKTCLDSSGCESVCVTEDSVPAGQEARGECWEWKIERGYCLNFIQDGKAQGVTCVD